MCGQFSLCVCVYMFGFISHDCPNDTAESDVIASPDLQYLNDSFSLKLRCFLILRVYTF